ncbi:MAG TPA: 2-amino-4-hydroxy-6-hydroxymethyldihydropteridine diphosphokinase [Vicinamibacterales bacterium]|nr:2-amino-4-hydroxy-6-hydroxymethyldihydropteridine diphosphokinase [Vicinamibacterales bacterium]
MSRAAIAIGSNLGNREAAIAFAAAQLSSLLANFTLSGIIETWPVGEGTDDQQLYLNAVATGETGLTARELLDVLLDIERAFGRARPQQNAARTLDLDLILLGDQVVDDDGLQVPHPRFRDRVFVLGPLAEIAPAMVDPVSGARVSDLLRMLLRDGTR